MNDQVEQPTTKDELVEAPATEVIDGEKQEHESVEEIKPDAEAGKGIDAEKAVKALQRRIDRLTSEKYKLRAENEQLRTPKQQEQDDNYQPTAEDINRQAALMAQEMVALKEFNKLCDDVADKGMKSGKKFAVAMETLSEEIGGAFDEKGKPSTAMLAILDADEPHKVILYLGEKPELSAELAKLPPHKQIRRIAQIEKEMLEEMKPKQSTAPKPAQPVKAAAVSGEPDPKDTKAWIKWENEKLLARRGRT